MAKYILVTLLEISLDAAYLASTGGSGPCRIWDLSTLATVASLSLDQARAVQFEKINAINW